MLRKLLAAVLVAAISGSEAEDESTALWQDTYKLGKRVEILTESMTSIVEDVNTAIASRREARAKLRETEEEELSTLKVDSRKKLKGLQKKVTSVVDKIRDLQKSKEKELNDLLKEKGCIRQQAAPTTNNEWVGEQQDSSKPSTPPPDPCEDSDDEYCQREEIKEAMRTSWSAYRKHAWGWDELMPVTKQGKNWAKGVTKSFGLTIHDSLTTLLIMGMQEEFEEALEWIESDFHPSEMDFTMSVFESIIRMVGGLISAYEFSGEKHPILLKKAKEVADIVLFAYNTSSGIPHASINYNQRSHGNPPWSGGSSVLSEFGTVQLEFRTMSFHTNNSIYDEKATWIMDVIEEKAPDDMLCPTYFSTTSFRWTSDHITLGALGDSFFEYLLKQYLLTGKTEERYKVMYEKAVGGIMKRLVQKANNKLAYVAEYKRGGLFHKMDHLACFSGGMLALGVQELERSDDVDGAKILKTAEEITETCYHMYHNTPTGVAPEIVEFHGGEMTIPGRRSSYYLLRPETVESFMYLWRITKKAKIPRLGMGSLQSPEALVQSRYGRLLRPAICFTCSTNAGQLTTVFLVGRDTQISLHFVF
eukprot:TRINITY_DN10363_c0_g1_i1.p1 TRINITY_DN10363_c0_g1~~TRINITY_DN10363_c0_g1_i1.p1  ORF type:complete len:589 (+),score=129.25 TRINITY_DN10363_c0_g1_i1:47-1813(+)